MRQQPFTAAQKKRLIANGQATAATGEGNHVPVVKYFTPWGAATWLITDYDPDTGLMFGLCDLGHGSAELGYVSLDELRSLRGPMGLTVERDLHFSGDATISEYADRAREQGWISA